MRALCGLCVLVTAGLLAGCGSEDVRQAEARRAVEARTAALGGYAGPVHCTGNPRPWFIEEQASVFLCVARRREGGCDRFRAALLNAGWDVVLDGRDEGCVLPS